MKEHFNLKSLTFYGVMIGSVLVLFKAISAYGENQLKAPQLVAGNYRLDVQALPECLGSGNLILNIEQSGIYLFGNLSASDRQIILDGKMNDGEISLSGKTNRLAECELSENSNSDNGIEIRGRTQEKTFFGEIKWDSNPQGINFTGTLEELPSQSELEH
jgi:hypothetical protein